MGAVESKLEHKYYTDSLSNINPSSYEFDYWIGAHKVFKSIYTVPSLFQGIDTKLASEALSIGTNVDSSQFELVDKLDQAAQIILKAKNYANDCSALALEILFKAHEVPDLEERKANSESSRLVKLGNYAKGFFVNKCEPDAFAFEFDDFQACLLEVIRFFHFIYDFDEHIQEESSYLLILESLKKVIGLQNVELPKIRTTPEELNVLISFLKSLSPMTRLLIRMIISKEKDYIELSKKVIARVVIICSMSLHKNLNLIVEDITILLKAITEGMLILESIEPLGCLSIEVAKKIPSELAVQTLGLYANNMDEEELQSLALRLLLALKARCKAPKQVPEVVRGILDKAVFMQFNQPAPENDEELKEEVEEDKEEYQK